MCVCVFDSQLQCEVCVCVFESGETERRPNGVGVHSSFSASCLAFSGRNAWMDYTAWLLQWLSNEAPLCLHPYLIHAGMTVSAKWKWGRKSNDPPVCCSYRGGGHVIREIKLHLVRAQSPCGTLPERVICGRTLGIHTVSKYVHKTYVRHERCDAIENRAEANILRAWIMQALQMHHPLKFHQNSDKSAAALEHTSRPSAGSITRNFFFFLWTWRTLKDKSTNFSC